MSNDVIIEANGIHKTYRSRGESIHALRGVDFQVSRGEMVAVMGPSGSGKTTLLNCLAGLDSVDRGDVIIDGQSLASLPDDQLSEYRSKAMGFVFQSYNLLPVLSALENVEMPLLIGGVKPATARTKARERLAEVGLSDWATHKPAELSGGQAQRVAVARALVNNPAIVWADEPTGNLDSETTESVIGLLCRLNRENKQTFVIVTHTIDVGGRSNRIVKMRDGLIAEDVDSEMKNI